MKDEKLKRAAEIQDAIRQILFDDWDPIGVNDYAPKDEYDAYIGVIYRRLVSGGTEDELSEESSPTRGNPDGITYQREPSTDGSETTDEAKRTLMR